MPKFYGKVLCETLKQAVERNLAENVSDQLSLLEELSIFRIVSSEAIKAYSDAEELIQKNPNGKNSKQLKATASFLVLDALKQVGEFCERAARVDNLQKDKFSIHTINSIVAQISRIIYEVVERKFDRRDIAEEIEIAIRDNLKVPALNGGTSGTSLTPDQDVSEMDAMVPKQ